jgi:hypothetical protein
MASTDWGCPQCSRDFATEGGLLSHLKSLHAAREKTPYPKPQGDEPVTTKD